MRWSDDRAVIVVPNVRATASQSGVSIEIPWEQWRGKGTVFTVTDLMSGDVIAEGGRADLTSFQVELPAEHLGIYLLEHK
jgi:hypothetical protein